MRIGKIIVALAAITAVGALIAGCGSSSSSSTTTSAASSTTAAAKPAATGAIVTVANNPKLGKIVTDSGGRTLYLFKKDKGLVGKSSCYGACAGAWPPYLTKAAPVAKGGVTGKLGTIKRTDGTTQVTFGGWPLYYYVSDTKPGDITGNDFNNFGASWYAMMPNGKQVPG